MTSISPALLDRRAWLKVAAVGLGGLTRPAVGAAVEKTPTRFQIACMTLPYARFPFQRALSGLKSAGYSYVAWGTTHLDGGQRVPVLAGDASMATAKELGTRCRDLGLEPVLTFGPSPESLDALKHRVRQASAAGVAQVLTMGNTKGNDRALWVKTFKELGPFARDQGVVIVVKPHGGNTGKGIELAEITREAGDEGVKVSYDAGNVMDYHDVDPLPDLRGLRRSGAWVLHQGPSQLPQGSRLRAWLRRDRSLPAPSSRRVHGTRHAALL